jgi:hypothetical protein
MVVVAGMFANSSPALACSIAFPTCVSEINGRESQRVDIGQESPNVSIFVERFANDGPLARLFLVDCRSRQGVWSGLPKDADFQTPVLTSSVDYLIEAASSDRLHSLLELRDHLRAEGLPARVNRLPDGHCGCSLPVLEIPACPEWSNG